jgi:hypothetical protein
MEIRQLWFNESPFRYHQFVFVPLTLRKQSLRNGEIDPLIWLLRKSELSWNTDLIISKYLIEILFPALRVSLLEP